MKLKIKAPKPTMRNQWIILITIVTALFILGWCTYQEPLKIPPSGQDYHSFGTSW